MILSQPTLLPFGTISVPQTGHTFPRPIQVNIIVNHGSKRITDSRNAYITLKAGHQYYAHLQMGKLEHERVTHPKSQVKCAGARIQTEQQWLKSPAHAFPPAQNTPCLFLPVSSRLNSNGTSFKEVCPPSYPPSYPPYPPPYPPYPPSFSSSRYPVYSPLLLSHTAL